MIKKTIETKNGFVIGFSNEKNGNFCWFPRHRKINNGIVTPIKRGDLEAYMNTCRQKIIGEKNEHNNT